MSVFSHNGSNIFSGAVNTVTKGLSTLTAGAASSDKSKEELEKENEQLKKENAELREQLVDYLDTKEENAKLWKYYELKKENPSYDIIPAGVGVVDSDYRGEICAGLCNVSDKPYEIEPFERICQMVIAPVVPCDVEEVAELGSTERGEGGFGSTGKK